MHSLEVSQDKNVEAMLYKSELQAFKYLFVYILKINFKVFPKENIVLVYRVVFPRLRCKRSLVSRVSFPGVRIFTAGVRAVSQLSFRDPTDSIKSSLHWRSRHQLL